MPKSIEHYQQESDSPENAGAAMRALDAMSELRSSAVCRHKSLVEYFGQEYATDNCNAWDVCLDELELVNDPITLR